MKLKDILIELRQLANESLANPDTSISIDALKFLRAANFTDAAIEVLKQAAKRSRTKDRWLARRLLAKLDEEIDSESALRRIGPVE